MGEGQMKERRNGGGGREGTNEGIEKRKGGR